MQMKSRVKGFDADWSSQIALALLFSNKATSRRVELKLRALAPALWDKGGGRTEQGGESRKIVQEFVKSQ